MCRAQCVGRSRAGWENGRREGRTECTEGGAQIPGRTVYVRRGRFLLDGSDIEGQAT